MYNFMTIKSIKQVLIDSQKYDVTNIHNFIDNKLNNLSKTKDSTNIYNEEQSIKLFVKDIIEGVKNKREYSIYFTDEEKEMIKYIISINLGNAIYYLKAIDEIENGEIFINLLEEIDAKIYFFKIIIKKLYEINKPLFSDYEDFIKYSFILIRFLSEKELLELDKQSVNLNNSDEEKKERSFLKALMSIIVYGMRYAGERGESGLSYNGIKIIREYSKYITKDMLVKILNYIAYEDFDIISRNPKSIKELINNSLKNIVTDLDELSYLKKFYKSFYIDSYWLFDYITDIAYYYISRLEEYQDYEYVMQKNNMSIEQNEEEITREILHKKDNETDSELIVHEIKNFKTKTIEYMVEPKPSNYIPIEIIKITFKGFGNDTVECIIESRNEEEKLRAEIKYNYNKRHFNVFGQVHTDNRDYLDMYDFQDEIENRINSGNVKKEVVEILYLYVDNMYGNLDKNFTLNFNKNYTFDVKDTQIIVNKNGNKSVLNNFFTIDEKANSNILSIHALVGGNGSGKTSIINLIRKSRMFGNEDEFNKETRYCLIFKISSTLYWISNKAEIKVKSNDTSIKLIESKLDDNQKYRNISVLFFSNIINLYDKKNINFNSINIIQDNYREKQQVDLSNQKIYNYELDSIYNYKYNDGAIKLINFSNKYRKQYKSLFNKNTISDDNEGEEHRNDEHKFKIKVLDYVYVEILNRNKVFDYINLGLEKVELNDEDKDNILNVLNNSPDLECDKEYKIIKKIVYQYYQEKKYKQIVSNTYESLTFVSSKDIIWKCIDEILCEKIHISNDEIRYKMIINLIINYYKYKSYITESQIQISKNDVVWKLIDDIEKNAVIINENRLKINLLKDENLINNLNKIIYEFQELKSNFIFYQIPNLSSGEMARLNFFSTLDFYWNQKDITRKIKKKNYILILDEVEAFFHPEWQRTFIYDLIYFLEFQKKHNNAFNSVQIIISSNSPFLISDLPMENVISIEDKGDAIGGLGQNIHNLLSNSFFMKSTIGEFAKIKINKIIEELNNQKPEYLQQNKYDIESKINIIGEPLIRNKLREMLYEKLIILR